MNISITQPCLRSQSLRCPALIRLILLGMLFWGALSCEQDRPKANVANEAAKAELSKPSPSNMVDGQFVEVKLEEKQCKAEGDCVLVSKTCCACTSGGQNDAMNAQFLSDLQKRRETGCADKACAAYVNESPNCRATRAKCVNKICVVLLPESKPIKTEPMKPE